MRKRALSDSQTRPRNSTISWNLFWRSLVIFYVPLVFTKSSFSFHTILETVCNERCCLWKIMTKFYIVLFNKKLVDERKRKCLLFHTGSSTNASKYLHEKILLQKRFHNVCKDSVCSLADKHITTQATLKTH